MVYIKVKKDIWIKYIPFQKLLLLMLIFLYWATQLLVFSFYYIYFYIAFVLFLFAMRTFLQQALHKIYYIIIIHTSFHFFFFLLPLLFNFASKNTCILPLCTKKGLLTVLNVAQCFKAFFSLYWCKFVAKCWSPLKHVN